MRNVRGREREGKKKSPRVGAWSRSWFRYQNEGGGLWLGGVGSLVVEGVISDGGPVVDGPLGAGEFYGRDDAQFLEVVECG